MSNREHAEADPNKHPDDSALDFDALVYCRACGKPLTDGNRLRCTNPDCPLQSAGTEASQR